MAAKRSANPRTPLGHFGRQVRKERQARGWTLDELSARTGGLAIGYISDIERGFKPPTERVADLMDGAFPERRGWFREYYLESRSWMPAGFRDWGEYEAKATELILWTPGIVDGLAQTEAYARELLEIHPGVTPEVIEARLKGRMARQRRLLRDGGPRVMLPVDMMALYRAVGSAEVMAEQCARLIEVAKLEAVTVQVVGPIKVPLLTALVIVTTDAAYTEHGLTGAVYTDDESVSRLRSLITTVRGEARPVSESLVIIREAEHRWTGVRRHTVAPTAGRASRRHRTAE
jgi:transcriptional regulator with XRE-family HTH domain